jgi:hypothetical protein
MRRAPWRGWQGVRLEARGAPPTAGSRRHQAHAVGLARRGLPRAPPEFNALEQRWRPGKGRPCAKRTTQPGDTSAEVACRDMLELSRTERLRKAGVWSGRFWLTS